MSQKPTLLIYVCLSFFIILAIIFYHFLIISFSQ